MLRFNVIPYFYPGTGQVVYFATDHVSFYKFIRKHGGLFSSFASLPGRHKLPPGCEKVAPGVWRPIKRIYVQEVTSC